MLDPVPGIDNMFYSKTGWIREFFPPPLTFKNRSYSSSIRWWQVRYTKGYYVLYCSLNITVPQEGIESQAVDRVNRIGQKKAVHVYQLIAENTVESKVLDIQGKKKQLIQQVNPFSIRIIYYVHLHRVCLGLFWYQTYRDTASATRGTTPRYNTFVNAEHI